MTEIHDGKQSVETKRTLSTRESPIIVYSSIRGPLSHTRDFTVLKCAEYIPTNEEDQTNGTDLYL